MVMASDVEEKKNINADDWLKQMQKQLFDTMESSMLMVEADGKLLCPVGVYPKSSGRTGGTLRRSITHEVTQANDKTTGVVGSNVEYAPYVDYKKHFLEQSIDKNKSAIDEKFKSLK